MVVSVKANNFLIFTCCTLKNCYSNNFHISMAFNRLRFKPEEMLRKNNPPMLNKLQIVHIRGNHWILVSNIICESGVVSVCDSLYESIDETTRRLILGMFHVSSINLVESQKQEGIVDCGLFAIATTTSLAHGANPRVYMQSQMRQHLVNCLESGLLTMFPCKHS